MYLFAGVIGADVRGATYIVRLDELPDTIWCKTKEISGSGVKRGGLSEDIANQCSSLLDDNIGDGVVFGMGYRKADLSEADRRQMCQDLTVDGNSRSTQVIDEHIYVPPSEFSSPACPQRFEESFFCSIPSGKTLVLLYPFGSTVGDFLIGEDAFFETRGSFERLTYAVDFNDVGSNSGNHGFSEK